MDASKGESDKRRNGDDKLRVSPPAKLVTATKATRVGGSKIAQELKAHGSRAASRQRRGRSLKPLKKIQSFRPDCKETASFCSIMRPSCLRDISNAASSGPLNEDSNAFFDEACFPLLLEVSPSNCNSCVRDPFQTRAAGYTVRVLLPRMFS